MLYPKKVEQLRNFTFVIIDDNQITALKTKAVAESFQSMRYLAMADNYNDGLDIVLDLQPDVVFLEIDPQEKESKLSLNLINEFHRYLTVVPKIIVTTTNDSLCLEAFKYGVFDYFIAPIEVKELRKTLFRLEKEVAINSIPNVAEKQTVVNEIVPKSTTIVNPTPKVEPQLELNEKENIELTLVDPILQEEIISENNEVTANDLETEVEKEEIIDFKEERTEVHFLNMDNPKEKPLTICVKSYGDYRYIDANDICYLQADNNSTDIHLNSGEMITAFKTLKHFEGVLTYPFERIHNSYIVNVDYVSRIHTGNAVCHIKGTTTKLPFSKSYKENIDTIIATIASGNYLEI